MEDTGRFKGQETNNSHETVNCFRDLEGQKQFLAVDCFNSFDRSFSRGSSTLLQGFSQVPSGFLQSFFIAYPRLR
jgi:hypothetical protein